MKKVLGCVLLAAILVICLGMRGVVPVDVDQKADDTKVTMYAEDGRSEQFDPSEAEAQKSVGWYDNFNDVITTMWKDDGSSIVVFKADVSKYEKDGYTTNHDSIFSKVFNPATEEEKDVLKSEVQTYIDNGWKRGNGKVDPDKPMVCLTFDDGPNPATTTKLLKALEENNARATFFMLGNLVKNVKGGSDTINKMKDIGCELGSHTYDHTQLTKLGTDALKKQVQDTNDNINDIAGQGATVLRPPYGSYNDNVKSVCQSLDQPIILWSIDTLDWKTKNADTSFRNVMDQVKDGDIILFHDIYEPSVEAAIRLIPALQDAGYQMVTVSEMGEAKIGGLKPGEVYTDFWDSTVKKLTNSSSSSEKSSGSSDSEKSSGSSNNDKKSNSSNSDKGTSSSKSSD